MSTSWWRGLSPEVFALVRKAFKTGWAAHEAHAEHLDEQACWELHVENEVLTECQTKEDKKEIIWGE